jgi:hypothetical protein
LEKFADVKDTKKVIPELQKVSIPSRVWGEEDGRVDVKRLYGILFLFIQFYFCLFNFIYLFIQFYLFIKISEGSKQQSKTTAKAKSKAKTSTKKTSTAAGTVKKAGGGSQQQIKQNNPLIVYAAYDYEPQSDQDIHLYENMPYLLKKVNYPWEEWCEISALKYLNEETGGVDGEGNNM